MKMTTKTIALAATIAVLTGFDALAAAKCLEKPTNLDFEQGGKGWKLGSGAWSIDEKGGRNGSKCLAWDSAKASSGDSYATQKFLVEGGCRYRFGGWIKCENLTQGGKPTQARMTIDWYNADGQGISGEDAFPVAENSVGNDGWVRFEGLTPPLLGRASIGQFRFTQPSKGVTGRFLVDDLNVEQVGSVPVEWLASTAYRNWAEGGEVRFHATLHINDVKTPLKTLEAVFVYTDASGRRAERRADAFDAETANATFRVADLASGAHPVALEVRRKSGGLLGSASLTFTRAPLAKRRVAFDAVGRTLVDGKRFFPIGTYSPLSPESLALVTNSPFNCICSYWTPTVAQLDAIAASGRFYCYNLSRSKSVIDRASLERIVGSMKGHPAMLAWYVFDEVPQGVVPRLRDMIGRLHELDPDHPAWGVTDKPHIIRAFLGTCDVLGMDPYPIGNRAGSGRNAISIASDWPLQARAECFDTLPQWQVPQTFNWKWYRKGETNPEFRFPTKAELESMTYQAITAGANGFFNFTVYTSAKKTERGCEFAENWGNVCAVAADVKSRTDLLLSDPGPAVEESPRHTVVRTWRTDSGDVHALVCNKTRSRVTGTLRVKGCEAVQVDLPAIGHSFVKLRKAVAKAPAAAAKTPLVNLDFEQGSQGWSVDRRIWKIVKGEGRNGSAALVYENSDTNAPYVFPIQRVPVEGGGVYKFGAWVKIERLEHWGKADKPSIYFDWWNTAGNKFLGAAYARPVVNNLPNTDGWEYYEGVSPVLPADASLGKLAAVVSKERVGRVRIDDFSFSPLGTKVVEFVATSRYRDEGWDGTIDFHVLQHVNPVKHPLSGLKAAFVVVGADGRERRLSPSLFTQEEAGISIPCSELAMGTNPVRYEIRTEDGKVLGEATCPFTRLGGDPKRKCYFDAHRRLLVDGKRFFPLGLYYGGPIKVDTPDFQRYLSGPFNTIMPSWTLTPECTAEIGRTGLKVISTVTGFVRGGWVKGCETKDGADRMLSARVRSIKTDPSLIAWYVSDEPPPSQVEALTEARNTLHREDPDHPVWGVTDKPNITRMFMRTMDVVGIDPYPIGNHSTRGKISICSEWVQEAESNLWGMAAWHVPQVFNWKKYRPNVPHPDHRFPTKEELANMTYQLIAGGANGLIGYTYDAAVDGRYDKPDGWQRVCEVYAELRDRIDLFLSDPGPAVVSVPAEVVARTWRTEAGVVKTLIVNKTRQAVRGEVRLADGAAVAYDLAPLGYEIFGSEK